MTTEWNRKVSKLINLGAKDEEHAGCFIVNYDQPMFETFAGPFYQCELCARKKECNSICLNLLAEQHA